MSIRKMKQDRKPLTGRPSPNGAHRSSPARAAVYPARRVRFFLRKGKQASPIVTYAFLVLCLSYPFSAHSVIQYRLTR